MKFHIAICDDDPADAKRLYELLMVCSFQMDLDLDVTVFTRGSVLLGSLYSERTFPYELILMDIEMPEESGISLADKLNSLILSDTLLVFVSNYPEYMSESFSVHPFDFLQKPVTQEKLKKLLNDVQFRLTKKTRQLMIVSKDELDVSLRVEDILYVQVLNAKSQDLAICTATDFYTKRGTLSDMKGLYPELFFPLNRSILVNLIHVHYLTDRNAILHNGTILPVSVRNRKSLIKLLKNNLTIPM
ncbi:MAG: LytTR family DNA-binding domain-containing protein [Eubacterium sp.]|nr:LytTR family DNA-binding domain-containing protein [Eubacterium sp.]